jgi:hypothetical protein
MVHGEPVARAAGRRASRSWRGGRSAGPPTRVSLTLHPVPARRLNRLAFADASFDVDGTERGKGDSQRFQAASGAFRACVLGPPKVLEHICRARNHYQNDAGSTRYQEGFASCCRSLACHQRSAVARVRIPYAPPRKAPANRGFFAPHEALGRVVTEAQKRALRRTIGARLAHAESPELSSRRRTVHGP